MTLDSILRIFYILFQIYGVILIIDVLLSWIPGSQNKKIPRIIDEIASWYFGIFTDRAVYGGIDFGTIIAIVIYQNIIGLFIGNSFFGLL